MASSRRTPTLGGGTIETYDSGGGSDHDVLSDWEEATDLDLVANEDSYILEIVGNSHDDQETMNGATTDATYYRVMRPASGNFHNGTPNITHFNSTADAPVLGINEPFTSIQDICATATIPSGSAIRKLFTINVAAGNTGNCIGCIAYDGVHNGTGDIRGFDVIAGIAANCLAHNIQDEGYRTQGFNAIWDPLILNCKSVGNSSGVILTGNAAGSVHTMQNVLCTDNTTDWVDSTTAGTFDVDNCADSDNTLSTSGIGGDNNVLNASVTYVNAAGDDFHLAAGDTDVIGQGRDQSSVGLGFDFDDDMDFTVVTGAWSIGFHNYEVAAAGNPWYAYAQQ